MRIKVAGSTDQPTFAPFDKPKGTEHLYWVDDGRNLGQQFHAYLVQFEKRQGDLLTFHFLSVADASDIPGSFTIDLSRNANDLQSDRALVWPDLPSTIPTGDGPPWTGGECGFLFLDHYVLDRASLPSLDHQTTMSIAADTSGGGTGKYPRTQ